MKRTKNGSYLIGRFEVFPYVGSWRWGPYNIGSTRVHRLGPVRVFVREVSS